MQHSRYLPHPPSTPAHPPVDSAFFVPLIKDCVSSPLKWGSGSSCRLAHWFYLLSQQNKCKVRDKRISKLTALISVSPGCCELFMLLLQPKRPHFAEVFLNNSDESWNDKVLGGIFVITLWETGKFSRNGKLSNSYNIQWLLNYCY